VGRIFAEARLEEYVQGGVFTSTGSLQQGLYSHDAASQTNFFYTIQSIPQAFPAPSTRTAHYLQTEVWWWNGGPNQSRAGSGMTSTRLGRLVVQ